jgi:hypothetical protein
MPFYIFGKHHNILHWLIVVIIRIINLFFWGGVSIYLISMGVIISENILKPLFPINWWLKFYELPYLPLLKNILIGNFGWWLTNASGWLSIVIGLPLGMISLCIFLINFFNLLNAVFSPFYNKTHCFFCNNAVKIHHKF